MKQKNKSVSWKINGGTNSGEQNKVKRMKKKLRTVSQTSGTISNAPTFES